MDFIEHEIDISSENFTLEQRNLAWGIIKERVFNKYPPKNGVTFDITFVEVGDNLPTIKITYNYPIKINKFIKKDFLMEITGSMFHQACQELDFNSTNDAKNIIREYKILLKGDKYLNINLEFIK